jgi:hypothetical protein
MLGFETGGLLPSQTGVHRMDTHLGIGPLRSVMRALRHAMFGLGVAVMIGVLGHAVALFFSTPAEPTLAKAKALQSLENRYATNPDRL